jgi:hypothetical protein
MSDIRTFVIGDPAVCSPAEIAERVCAIEEDAGVTLVSTYVSVEGRKITHGGPGLTPAEGVGSMLYGIFRKNTAWGAHVSQSTPFKPEAKSLEPQEG